MPWVSQKDIQAFRDSHDVLMAEIDKLKKRPFLLSMERVGRLNKFVFCRDGEIVEVETMGLLSDNLPEWKAKLMR
jgi:hypothetical protein